MTREVPTTRVAPPSPGGTGVFAFAGEKEL